MRVSEYRGLTALALAERVRSGAADPVAVTEAALAAIAEANPGLNAVVLTDAEGALRQAAAVDRTAPLAGVPVLIKDNNQYVSGWPTTYSCRFYEGAEPMPDSAFVRRLRSAGAVLVGKTNTPEFAEDWTTEPTLRGPTRNPWDLDRSPGGSSGGSAAAVAGGMAPAAHGNDNGGSIRVPAAVCGLFGLKPSRGLVPIGPYFGELAAGLNSEHMLTRDARDSAAFLDVLADPEPGARYQVRRAVPSYLAALEEALPRLRVGVAREGPGGAAIHPDIADAVARAERALKDAGHETEAIAFPDDSRAMAEAERVCYVEIAMLVRQRERELGRPPRPDEIEALTAHALAQAAGIDAVEYLDGLQRMHRETVRILAEIERFDLLLTPTTGEPAPLLGHFDSRTADFDYTDWSGKSAGFAPFTGLFNVTGQPAASVPAGLTAEGLPIGVQLVGRPGRDDTVLQAGLLLERALGPLPAAPFLRRGE